jgi:hypothetical protein
MGLKIKGIEFVYPGTTRLLFNSEGKICDHRDYFGTPEKARSLVAQLVSAIET